MHTSSGVPAKRQHPYRRESSPTESRQTRKMTRSASLGSNLGRNPCASASAPAKKEQIELEVWFLMHVHPLLLFSHVCLITCCFTITAEADLQAQCVACSHIASQLVAPCVQAIVCTSHKHMVTLLTCTNKLYHFAAVAGGLLAEA